MLTISPSCLSSAPCSYHVHPPCACSVRASSSTRIDSSPGPHEDSDDDGGGGGGGALALFLQKPPALLSRPKPILKSVSMHSLGPAGERLHLLKKRPSLQRSPQCGDTGTSEPLMKGSAEVPTLYCAISLVADSFACHELV